MNLDEKETYTISSDEPEMVNNYIAGVIETRLANHNVTNVNVYRNELDKKTLFDFKMTSEYRYDFMGYILDKVYLNVINPIMDSSYIDTDTLSDVIRTLNIVSSILKEIDKDGKIVVVVE